MNRSTLLPIILSAIISLAVQLSPVNAGISYTGQLDPADPADWDDSTDAYIGENGDGFLNVNKGSALITRSCMTSGVSTAHAEITITGDNSTWNNTGCLYVGGLGTTLLNIQDMSYVSSGAIDIGCANGAFGVINISGSSTELYDRAQLIVGVAGSGEMNICSGATVGNSIGSIGNNKDSHGYVLVDGKMSTWNSHSLNVGELGCGLLVVSNGGRVNSNTGNNGCSIGAGTSSIGIVKVDGAESKWINTGQMCVGWQGKGTLEIINGGTVSDTDAAIGYNAGSIGCVIVDGSESSWLNSGGFLIGNSGIGKLSLSGGGRVTSTIVSVGSQSLMAIDVGYDSILSIYSGSGKVTNNGIICILAGAGVATDGAPYSPIVAGSWTGSGVYQAIGGTWNETTHEFTVSDVLSGDSSVQLTLDLVDTQRALIADNGEGHTGWTLGASFLHKHKTGEDTALLLTATAIDTLGDLQLLLGANDSVLGAWEIELAGDGYTEDDPVYLSFDIGEGFKRGDLTVWHFDEGVWTEFDAMDLTVNDGWASFTATEFSGYAVTVPEPGTLVLLLIAALGLMTYARSGRRQIV